MTLPDRGAVKMGAAGTDTCGTGFEARSLATMSGERVIRMMFMVLLVPLALLALLLGMERLERWTVAERDDA